MTVLAVQASRRWALLGVTFAGLAAVIGALLITLDPAPDRSTSVGAGSAVHTTSTTDTTTAASPTTTGPTPTRASTSTTSTTSEPSTPTTVPRRGTTTSELP